MKGKPTKALVTKALATKGLESAQELIGIEHDREGRIELTLPALANAVIQHTATFESARELDREARLAANLASAALHRARFHLDRAKRELDARLEQVVF
jgi:hypothetical protein